MFSTFSDGMMCPGVNCTMIGVEPGSSVALAIRALLLEDATIHVPMSGIATPIFRRTEEKIRDAGRDGTIPGKRRASNPAALMDYTSGGWAKIVSELESIADRFPTLSARVIESDDMLKLLAAFGVTREKNERLDLTPAQECLIELNNTINLRETSAACPFHALHAYDTLAPLANEVPISWFASSDAMADLSPKVLNLIASLAFIRFATAMPSAKLVTSITTERTARTLAAADALRKLASIVASIVLVPKLARINSLMSFISSDLAVDVLRDEEGIRLRTALLAKFAAVDGIDMLGFGAEMKAFFAPKSIKVNGLTLSQYQLPSALVKAVRAVLTGIEPAPSISDSEALPAFTTIEPGLWAVSSPRDALATRSKLFDIAYVGGRGPQLAAVKLIIDAVHASMRLASGLLDDIAKDDMLAVVPGGVATIRQATSFLPNGAPTLKFGNRPTNDPALDVPAVMSANMSSLGAVDPADLKQRPLVCPVTGDGGNAVSEVDIASLGGMYISALPQRLGYLKAPETAYLSTPRPVVPFFFATNPIHATGFWPLMESQKFYQLYPHCYAPHLMAPVSSLDIAGLSRLIPDMPGYASLNILRRDTVPDLRLCSASSEAKNKELAEAKESRRVSASLNDPDVVVESRVATALRFVGFIVSVTGGVADPKLAGNPREFANRLGTMLKAGSSAQTTPVPGRLLIARPDTGYGKFIARHNRDWPTTPSELSDWVRYASVEQFVMAVTELSLDGSWWFVASSHVPPLLPFDGVRMDIILAAIEDEPCVQQMVDSYRIIGRPGYIAHLASTAYGLVLENKDKPVTSKPHEPYLNKPWRGVIPAGANGDKQPRDAWWPTNGIVSVESDVRSTIPFCLRAGVRNSRDIHLLFERAQNALPKARASVPSGTIFMTDEPATALSKLTLTPQQQQLGVSVSVSDWVAGYSDPTKVSTVAVI